MTEAYFWIMTIQTDGFIWHFQGTTEVNPGETRHDVYERLRAWFTTELAPDSAGGAVLFFDLQPNKL